MTEHLHEKGETDRKHARQPEGPTGEREKPPAETIWGGEHENEMCPTAAIAKRSANPEFLAGRQVSRANSLH
jgi:hypothetical protein